MSKRRRKLRILLADWSTENDLSRPDPWWRAGTHLAALFFTVIRCRTVEDAYKALDRLDPEAGDEIEVWCHAGPGAPMFGGKVLDDDHPVWKKCRGATVWIRGCDALRGAAGIAFAEKLARLGLNVAGHLAEIGLLGHSYLVGLKAGATAKAWWPAGFDGEKSGPFKPRTVRPTHMGGVPKWAFDPKKPL